MAEAASRLEHCDTMLKGPYQLCQLSQRFWVQWKNRETGHDAIVGHESPPLTAMRPFIHADPLYRDV